LGAISFVPPSHSADKGPLWKQLRRPAPRLLTVFETLNTQTEPPEDEPTETVIITPAPPPHEDSEVEDAKSPLITPAPLDDDDILELEAEPEQEQTSAKAPPPVVARRSSRRSARSRTRGKRSNVE